MEVKLDEEPILTGERRKEGKLPRVVYITRHGMRLDWVKPDWHLETGEKACDSPLSEEGLKQARELGERLAEDVELDFIFSSPFFRCVQTADAVAAAQQERRQRRRQARQQSVPGVGGGGVGSGSTSEEADDVVVPIFVEHALGEWDDGKRISPRTTAELKALFPRVDDETYTSVVLPHKVDDDADETYRGESVHELHERCERFVKFVNQHEIYGAEGKHILFVGHAASTIAFYRAWMQDRTADFFPATCSLSKLVQLHDDAGEVDVVIGDSVDSSSSSPSRRPQEKSSVRWKAELWGDCSHLSGGQQKPWRFSESHDQSLALAASHQ